MELLNKIKGLSGSFRDKLNELGIGAETKRGKVISLQIDDGETCHTLSPDELKALEIDPEDIGYVGPHPEGADRGGHVVYVETPHHEAYFDEAGGSWCGW